MNRLIDRLKAYFGHRDTLIVTICFDIGKPLKCEYRGTPDELYVLTKHVPTTGSMMGDQKVWKVQLEVN